MEILVCSQADLSNGDVKKVIVKEERYDREIFVSRLNGEVFSYYNECPHLGIALDWDDNDLISQDKTSFSCKNHGAIFNPETGVCTAGPCVGAKLKSVPVCLKNESVYLEI